MITWPISKSISRSIDIAINDPSGAGFSPISLFGAGEQGVWYDPSDLSTLFQDAAGTIPVTAAGQPVGMMMDKSGGGNHATQSTATSRPILQSSDGKWYLAFDGVDDGMVTGNIDLSTSNRLTIWAGILKISDAATGVVCEFSLTINTNVGCFLMSAPLNAGVANYAMHSKGTTSANNIRSPFAAPHKAVLTAEADIGAPSVGLRVNSSAATPSKLTQGTGNYGVWPLYIGRRGGSSLPLNGNLYGLIVRSDASSASQIANAEDYMNSKTGAY